MKICIIGSGYVGLVTGACFSDLGNTVTCVDINKEVIKKLNKGIIPIYEPGLQELVERNLKKKRLLFSTNISNSIKKSDIIFICVGTPTKNNKADLKYVFNVIKSKITKILKSNKNNNKFDVVSNPEFLREGEAIRDFQFPDRVVVGTSSNKANKIMKKLYLPLIKKGGRYFHTSRRSAELIKYASNAFLATKITFINEIANLCEKSNIDVKEVAIGMGLDERIGSRFLTNLSVVKSVINSNDKRTNLLLNKISKIMNNKIKNKNITFLGVTFKPGTDDMRESSSLKMIPSLIRKGAHVNYYEPTGKKKELKSKNINFFENIKDACKSADLIIIHTEWNEFKQLNFKKITKKRNFKVFDMRNLYSTSEMKKNKINYFSIGR